VSISSDDDTDSTKLDGEYHSELDPDVDMCMEDDVDAADSVDTMVDNQPIVLPVQHMHTPRPQPPVPAPWPQTPEPHPRPQTLETYPLSGLEHLGLVTPRKPRPAVPTLRQADPAGNTSYVDVDQQLLIESAGGDSLPDLPLPDVPLPEERQDCLGGEE
jgi:hypothetical protein